MCCSGSVLGDTDGLGRRYLSSLQPWRWRSLCLNHNTGSAIFSALFQPIPAIASPIHCIATLLESPYPLPPGSLPNPTSISSETARYSICAGAPRFIRGQFQLWTPAIDKILPTLASLLRQPTLSHENHFWVGPEAPETSLPFTGGWLGWLGYDLAWEIERLPYLNPDPLPFPVAYWYEPEQFAVLDHDHQRLWLAATHPHQLDEMQWRLEHHAMATAASSQSSPNSNAPNLTSDFNWETLRFGFSQADYEAIVLKAKHYIQAGDIFQANLSLRFETQTTAESWAIYRQLQSINPSPFASYWRTPWGEMISGSPERLVQLTGQRAQTRPIAGTRSRGSTPDQDRQLAQDLVADAKEHAEHIMLLDLERNDLGRVCQWGSVQVSELLTIERYSHVMHLVSNVIGVLQPNRDAIDLIRAMFPGGTITGCPKVRCMEIIEELEPLRRSLFYGSCGYLDWRGNLDLNILIRTLLLSTKPTHQPSALRLNQVWGQVGAGIVADSNPEREWCESLQKAKAQFLALGRSIPA